jgi:DNA ligase (NAD+)
MKLTSVADQLQQRGNIDFTDGENFYPSNFIDHEQELNFLAKQGFPVNPFNQNATTIDEVITIFSKLHDTRQDLPYPIDGLVVKLSSNVIAGDLGVVGKTPRAWCAMKFAAEEVTTRLLDILWQVGRTGRLTPVACLEETELVGTIVKRATLHNYKEVLEKDLHYRDTVIIRKAGDIIPEVVQVLVNLRTASHSPKHDHFDKEGKVLPPTYCPSCETKLEISDTGVDIYCPNITSCHDQVVGRLVYYCQRNMANITGLSDKIVEKFIQEYDVHDVYDLYRLPWDQIRTLEGFGEKSVENLSKSVANSKHMQDYRFLSALGIDGVGPEVAKLICEKLNEIESYDS